MGEKIKQEVIRDVIQNLGPLQEKAGDLIGPLENIIGHAIEKHVLATKPQMRILIHQAREEARDRVFSSHGNHTTANRIQMKPPA